MSVVDGLATVKEIWDSSQPISRKSLAEPYRPEQKGAAISKWGLFDTIHLQGVKMLIVTFKRLLSLMYIRS